MANFLGKERVSTTQNVLLVGHAAAFPIFCNPNAEQLRSIGINLNNEPTYEITQNGSRKMEFYLRVPYQTTETSITQGVGLTEQELIQLPESSFVKLTYWASSEPAVTKNGAWYVNSRTSEVKYVKTDEIAPEGFHIALKGEADLHRVLSACLRLEETDVKTPFIDMFTNNDFSEINSVFKAININHSAFVDGEQVELAPKAIKVMLGVVTNSDGDKYYQDVYSKKITGFYGFTKTIVKAINDDRKTEYPWKGFQEQFLFGLYNVNNAPELPTVTGNKPVPTGLPF